MIKDQVIKAIKSSSGIEDIHLEFPENEEFGDYSTNAAMVQAKKTNENPRELAEKIKDQILKNKDINDLCEKIEVAGPGFINFWLKKDILVDNLIYIDSTKENYGTSASGKGKTVVIDYSSPNIAKPFSVGHLRSTIIGKAIYNLYKFLGYEVIGDNHLGDWGTQFGKLIYMIQKDNTQDFSIENLEKLYVEFHHLTETDPKLEEEARKLFKKLEEGDKETKEIWQKCVDVSLKEFERIYNLLEVKIDFAFGESYYESEMRELMDNPSVKKYLKDGEDGAKIIDLTKEGIKTPLMFMKSDGATTYATRDLATIAFRVRKWNPDIIIYEVGAEQTLHFQQLFAAVRLLGLVKKDIELVHTRHGLYLGEDGKKFSTRKGKTIKLEEVLDEAIERAKKLGNEDGKVAKEVGIGAIKYFDLMHSVQSDVVFDWEKMMNLEGNSGPYIQYTFARTQSVLEKAKSTKDLKKQNKNLNKEELSLLRFLSRFPEIIMDSAKNYSPNILASYLFALAQKYNNFYNVHRIIGSENEELRLKLTSGTGQILKNGLKLLGISTPEKM